MAILPLALGCGAFAEPRLDLYSIDFSFPLSSNEPADWYAQTYRALHHVDIGQFIGETLLLAGHDRFGLATTSNWSRVLYLALAGQIDFRFQAANSIILAHEMAHFRSSVFFGGKEFGFTSDNGQTLSLGQVYLNAFTGFYPGGPATVFDFSAYRPNRDPSRNFHAGEGLNVQSWISERKAQSLLWEPQSVFSASAYLVNRFFTAGYAYLDLRNGDIEFVARNLARRIGNTENTVSGQILLYSLAASLLSPATWRYLASLGDYVAAGTVAVAAPTVDVAGLGVSYDIPTYINATSFSLSPSLYVVADRDLLSGIGIDKILLGIGGEFAVIGTSAFEPHIFVRLRKGRTELAMRVTSGDGFSFEPEIRYALTPRLDLLAAGHFSAGGPSLRSRRLTLFDQQLFWVGIGFRW